MLFSEGDIVIDAHLVNDFFAYFVRYSKEIYGCDCYIRSASGTSEFPAKSGLLWFAKGRHVITEAERHRDV